MPKLSKTLKADYWRLIEAAKAASELAYRPYSKFNVGAAILTKDGEIYTGCNVENCGYSQTIHAEETALSKAISEGALVRAIAAGRTQLNFIEAIAVYAPKGSDPWPCCNCRQTLNEFGLDMNVIGIDPPTGEMLCKPLAELIPHPFPMEEVLASVNGTSAPATTATATQTSCSASGCASCGCSKKLSKKEKKAAKKELKAAKKAAKKAHKAEKKAAKKAKKDAKKSKKDKAPSTSGKTPAKMKASRTTGK